MAAEAQANRVTVFGGTGFLGREIVLRLGAQGWSVRVAVRHPDSMALDEDNADSGRVEAVYADIRDETTVALALEGSVAAVNAVGLYVEKGAETFESVHELGAVNLAHQAALLGVERLVHLSGIGADLYSDSDYVRARAKGELLVRDVFAPATILRPSVLFGPQDSFLNSLARITRQAPLMPLFGKGETRLQPVYVGDVAAAVECALRDPQAPGGIYELGGPRTYSYRELIELVLGASRQRCLLMPLPFAVWQGLASAAAVLPNPPLTRAQVALMRQDNVVSPAARTLADLGIDATALEDVLAAYSFS